MRPDDINPRTGLVVALVSVFLVFGFMFTVSGIKGETLGDIPLLAIGPAICLPGIAAIALARKTDGCTRWPQTRCCPTGRCCCCRGKPDDKDALELLRTPSDLESAKGSCHELAKAAYAGPEAAAQAALSTAAQEEMLRYLDDCYPHMPGNVFVAAGGPCGAARSPPAHDPPPGAPLHSVIVCSYSPDDAYCCYINPGQQAPAEHRGSL